MAIPSSFWERKKSFYASLYVFENAQRAFLRRSARADRRRGGPGHGPGPGGRVVAAWRAGPAAGAAGGGHTGGPRRLPRGQVVGHRHSRCARGVRLRPDARRHPGRDPSRGPQRRSPVGAHPGVLGPDPGVHHVHRLQGGGGDR